MARNILSNLWTNCPEVAASITAFTDSVEVLLWTCRVGDKLQEAVEWCREHGLLFDAVNDNLSEMVEKWGSNSRKITADIYIDDKAEAPWELIIDKAV